MRQENTPSQELENNKLVLLLDRSSLMPWADALPALGAFLNLFQLGDRFAVLSYRYRALPIYPLDGLALYDDRAVLDQATNVLLSTTGGGDKSNLSAGLAASRKRLDGQEGPKAIVLVASSRPNAGRNPVVNLPDYPVETIALGDNGEQDLLRTIALETGGRYAYCEDTTTLMSALIEVIEHLGIAQILALGTKSVGNQQPYSLVGRVPADTAMATFLVYWGDPTITYGTGTGTRWVTTELLDPTGKPYGDPPVWAGQGFAVYSVPDPAAGSWSLKSTFVGAGKCTFTNTILV